MIVDLFLVYQFLRRLATPFKEWKAYELGIIDAEGNILKKSKELTTIEERKAWGKFDLMILKLKRLLAKVPGGSSRIASYAAALYLIKEHNNVDANLITEEELTEGLQQYMMIAESNVDIDFMFEEVMNSAGSGAIAGIGIGKDGEPGLTPAQMRKHKKKAPLKRFSDTIGK